MPTREELELNEVSEVEKNGRAVADTTVEILADVLRIFAARGRAIREAREKNGQLFLDPLKSKNDQLFIRTESEVQDATSQDLERDGLEEISE